MTRRSHHHARRRIRLLVLGGLLASAVPVSGATGPLGGTPAQAADGEPSYGGYTATAWSSPIRIEVFEPSFPIPVDAGKAQLEFLLGYSKVLADSGMSSGRSSLFWPGDPVGEGLRTFAEQIGLPADNPLTGKGYPVQVNSQYPGDRPTQKDEQVPGSIQRTTSGDRTAIAETGFSPDGAVAGPDETGEGGGDGGGPANPLGDLTEQLQGLLGGGLPAARDSAPVNPLAMLVDVDGYVSVSRMDATEGPVTAVSRSILGEVRLLGGLVTLGGLETVARTTTDGTSGKATGKAVWGSMSIGGQEFGIGPDGAIVAGKPSPIPGLQDVPADALEQLGITIQVPKPVRTVDGDLATSESAGIRVIIETAVLAPLLKALPAGALAELVPADAGPLRGVVAGLASLSPKIVLTLGAARSTVDTVPPIAAAPAAPVPDAVTPPAATSAPPAAGAVGVPPAAGPAPAGAAPAPAAGTPVTDLVDAAPASAGLPELFTIPGMLLVGAFVGAVVAGSWFRRLGAAALGAGAPCAHGLDSGLPDLRKA